MTELNGQLALRTGEDIIRAGMQRDIQAAEAFQEAKDRIDSYVDEHRADFITSGIRYSKLLDDLVCIEPPVDEEDYLVQLSRMKRRGTLMWGPVGDVTLSASAI